MAKKQRLPEERTSGSSALPAAKSVFLRCRVGRPSPAWIGSRGPQHLVTATSPTGVQALLSVDLRGKAKPVLQESEKDLGWAIPSPDGRHLAIWEASGNSNAWLLDGF